MNKVELARQWSDEVLVQKHKNGLTITTSPSLKEAFIAGYEARNEEVKILKEKIHWWKKEVNVAHKAREDEFEKLVIENKALKRNLDEAKILLSFWLNDVYNALDYDYEDKCKKRSKAVKETEKFIKEVK